MIKESKLIGTKVSMPYGWREFKVGDLFDVSGTHGFDKGDIVLSSHGTEFIGRTEVNNGVQGFYDDPFVAPNEANTISISQIGAQTAQYRRNQWYASQNLFKLIPKFDMHERHALFLLGFINKGLSIYSGYSHFPKIVDITDMQLLLPVTQDEQPDYGWMSSYIRELEQQRIRELDTYLQVTGLDDTTLTDNELQVLEQWRQHEKFGGTLLTKRFAPLELFKVYRGTRITTSNRVSGKVPLVTAGSENMGITEYINNPEQKLFNENIDVSLTIDMFGNCFTRDYEFNADDNILVLQNKALNKLHMLFINSVFQKALHAQFNYGSQFRLHSLDALTIELPVTNNGTPDYDFMQTFIRAQEKLVMQNLSEFRQRQIDTTRQII